MLSMDNLLLPDHALKLGRNDFSHHTLYCDPTISLRYLSANVCLDSVLYYHLEFLLTVSASLIGTNFKLFI